MEGTADNFTECFIDEGNLANKLEIMFALKENGFNSFLIDDHVPHMIDDTRWGHRGRAYAIGYLQALVDVINKVPSLANAIPGLAKSPLRPTQRTIPRVRRYIKTSLATRCDQHRVAKEASSMQLKEAVGKGQERARRRNMILVMAIQVRYLIVRS